MTEEELLLKINSVADTAGFDKVSSKTDKLKAVLGGLGKAAAASAAAAGIAILGIGAASVATAADFEQGMSKVQAISNATDAQMEALTAQAKELGATTSFTAKEASEGMSFLAMAGFEVNEVLDAMPSVLSLAAAEQMDLGRASDITSNILSGFQMEASEATRVADMLSKAASTANTNVDQLGEGFKMAGPLAASMSKPVEEVGAALGKLADAGIQGAEGGTAVRNMLLRLSAPSSKAAGIIEELGLNLRDAEGNMRSVPELIGELNAKMGELDQASRDQKMAELFGARTVGAVNVLLGVGQEELAAYQKELENATGFAEGKASKQMDNFKGAITKLQSAIDGVKIAIGTPLLGGLQSLTEGVTEMVGSVTPKIDEFVAGFSGDVPAAMSNTEAALIGLEDPLQAGREKLTGVQKAALKARDVYDELAGVFGTVKTMAVDFFDGLQAGASAGAGPLQMISDGLLNLAGGLPEGPLRSFVETLSDGFMTAGQVWSDTLEPALASFQSLVGELWSAIEPALAAIGDAFLNVVVPAVLELVSNVEELWDTLEPIFNDMKDLIVDTVIPGVIEVFQNLMDGPVPALMEKLGELQTVIVDDLAPAFRDNAMPLIERMTNDIFPKFQSIIAGPVMDILTTLISEGLSPIIPIIETLGPLVLDIAGWLSGKLLTGFELILDIAGPIIQFLSDHKTLLLAVAAVIATIATGGIPAFILALAAIGSAFDEIKETISGWVDGLSELWDKAIDGIKSAFGISSPAQVLIDIGKDLVAGLRKGIENAWSGFMSWLRTQMGRLPSAVKAFFGIRSPSRLFQQFGTWIMEGLALGIQMGGQTAYEAMQDALQRLREAVEAEAEAQAAFFEQTGGLSYEAATAELEEAMRKRREKMEGDIAWLEDQHQKFQESLAGQLEEGGAAAEAARAQIEAHKIMTEGLIQTQRISGEADIRDLREELERIESDHQAWQEAIQAVEEAYRAAQAAIKEAQRAAEEEANRIHDLVMEGLQEHRDAREAFWQNELDRGQEAHDAEMDRLQAEQDRWEDYIAEREERVSDMKLALEGLKLDLDVPAQERALEAANAELDRMQEKLELIRDTAQSFQILEIDPRKEKENQIREMREKVRALTDDQRTLLQEAIDSGMLSEDQLRTAQLLMRGYKARATDVAEIFELLAERQEARVDQAEQEVSAEERKLAHMHEIIRLREEEIALAEHELNVEKDRVEEILKGIEERREKEIARWEAERESIEEMRDLELEAIDAAMERERERHEQRLKDIAAQFAFEMALLDHSEAEIQAMIERAMEEVARIEERAEEMIENILGSGLGGSGGSGSGFGTSGGGGSGGGDRAGVGALVDPVVDAIGEASRDLSLAIGDLGDVGEELWRRTAEASEQLVDFESAAMLAIQERDRSLPDGPSFRDLNQTTRQGRGGFRAGGFEAWLKHHHPDEWERVFGQSSEFEFSEAADTGQPVNIEEGVIDNVTVGEISVEATVIVQIGDEEVESVVRKATIENTEWLDDAGQAIGVRRGKFNP